MAENETQSQDTGVRPQNNLGGSSDNTPSTATPKEAEKNSDSPKEPKKEEKPKVQPKPQSKPKVQPKEEVKEEKAPADVSFETTQNVELHVGKKKYAGRNFTFPANVVEDRKRVLREAYGEGIIK